MKQCTTPNVLNGIFSGITLICGIILAVLIGVLLNNMADAVIRAGGSGFTYSGGAGFTTGFWAIGFAFIIPGLIGVIATLVRVKGVYIGQMVVMIIVLVVMGIIFVIAILALGAIATVNVQCFTVGNSCSCTTNTFSQATVMRGSTCEELNANQAMGKGMLAMIVIGWITCLIATIFGGILACRNEPGQAGVVIHQPNQNMNMVYAPSNQVPPTHQAYGYSNEGAKY